MEQSSLSKYDRVKVTACASLTFINDILTQSVMDLIQMAKNLGIYKHRRKQLLNLIMTEIKKYEHFMFVESGEMIDQRACQCEAFMEQVEESKQRLLTEAEKVLTDGEVPYSSYLSYIHLTRATCMAAEIAIKGWSKKLVATAYPKRSDYNMNIFRQKNFEIRLQQLVTFEFGPYQDRKKESEESVNATKAYLQKLTDTDMICRIIGGQIKPSWVVEDEKKAEEEANKSEEEEPNKTEEDSVIKE